MIPELRYLGAGCTVDTFDYVAALCTDFREVEGAQDLGYQDFGLRVEGCRRKVPTGVGTLRQG